MSGPCDTSQIVGENSKKWVSDNCKDVTELLESLAKHTQNVNDAISEYNQNPLVGTHLSPLNTFDSSFTAFDSNSSSHAALTRGDEFYKNVDAVNSMTEDWDGNMVPLAKRESDYAKGIADGSIGSKKYTESDRADALAAVGYLKLAREELFAIDRLKAKFDELKQGWDDANSQDGEEASRVPQGKVGEDVSVEDFQTAVEEGPRALAEQEAQRKAGFGQITTNQNVLGITFQEQCLLQAQLFTLLRIKEEEIEVNSGKLKKLAYKPRKNQKSPNSNASILMNGDPFAFVNKLTQSQSTASLFDLPSEVLSQLQPMIRLFKVVYDNNKEREIEIFFPGSLAEDANQASVRLPDMLKNRKLRGHGVGLTHFSFAYEGSDPFAVKKSISAELKIHAASFEELTKNRGDYAISDLALKTGKDFVEQVTGTDPNKSKGVMDNASSLQFRLKAIVGYKMPKKLYVASGAKKSIEDAIKNSYITLNLTPTIHEFELDDSGRVNLTIKYLSYIEDNFDQLYYDIFSDPYAMKQNYIHKLKVKSAERQCDAKKLAQLKDSEKKGIREGKDMALRLILTKMFNRNLFYYIKIPYADLQMAAELGPSYNLPFDPDILREENNTTKQMEESASKSSGKDSDKEYRTFSADQAYQLTSNTYEQVTFFFLHDLVDVILEGIDSALGSDGYMKLLSQISGIDPTVKKGERERLKRHYENFKKLRVVLGPIEIVNPLDPSEYKHVSIGDLPISLNYFNEWMTKNLLSKKQTSMSLTGFLNKFIKNYLRNFLNDNTCHGDISRQRVSLFSSNITAYNKQRNVDELTQRLAMPKVKLNKLDIDALLQFPPPFGTFGTGAPILSTMGVFNDVRSTKGVDNETNYMIFYAGRSRPKNLMVGNYRTDLDNGIFHYVLGKDIGIVKNIRLERVQSTGLKEVRFEQEGYDGLQQLREVYNVNIDTFSFPNALPGTYLFVDPRGFSPSSNSASSNGQSFDKYDLSQYGIGGYFMIVKSEHFFGIGEASSSIYAAWVSEIESKDKVSGVSTKVNDNVEKGRRKKCRAERTRSKSQATESMNLSPISENTNI